MDDRLAGKIRAITASDAAPEFAAGRNRHLFPCAGFTNRCAGNGMDQDHTVTISLPYTNRHDVLLQFQRINQILARGRRQVQTADPITRAAAAKAPSPCAIPSETIPASITAKAPSVICAFTCPM